MAGFDWSKVPDADLQAIEAGDMTKVSDATLARLSGPDTPSSATTMGATTGGKLHGFAKGAMDVVDGGAQMLAKTLPNSIVRGVNDATRYVNDLPGIGPVTKALGMTPATGDQIDTSINDREKQYQAGRAASGRDGIDWMRMAGNAAALTPAMMGSGLAATGLGRIGMATAQGAGLGVLQPVLGADQAEFGDAKLKQGAIGAAGGAVGGLFGEVAGRVIRPAASINPDIQRLKDAGVNNLTPGQLWGGHGKALEEKLKSVPLLGGSINKAEDNVLETFNRGAYRQVADKVGATVPKDMPVGREGIAALRQGIIDPGYEAARKNVTFVPDKLFTDRLDKITNMVSTGLPNEHAVIFNKKINDEVLGRLVGTGNGSMDGTAFKAMERELGQQAKKLHGPPGFQQDLGAAYKEVLAAAREAIERSNPADAKALQGVNAAFSNFSPIRRASTMMGSDSGVFTPKQLMSAIKANDITSGKRAFSEGGKDLQKLTEAAQRTIGNTVNNSGTADRALQAAGAMAAVTQPHLIPGMLAGAAGGAGIYSEPMRKLLMGAMTNRGSGDFADLLAQAVRYGTPLAGIAGAERLTQ